MLMIQLGKPYVTIKRARINRKFINQNGITLPHSAWAKEAFMPFQPKQFGVYQ